jgi:hypothetical protein
MRLVSTDEIITRRRGRRGKSEQPHDVLKNDFGGSHVPYDSREATPIV